MNLRVVRWNPKRRLRSIEEFLTRPTFDPKAEAVAAELLDDVRKRGEPAVLAAAARIDGVALRPSELRVAPAAVEAAEKSLDDETKARIREAHDRVADFARRSMRQDWSYPTPGGGRLDLLRFAVLVIKAQANNSFFQIVFHNLCALCPGGLPF